MPKPWTILEAPLATTPDSAGTRGLAGALLRTGFATRIGAGSAGACAETTTPQDLAKRADTILNQGARPIILGGDCSVALAAGAMRVRGRIALAYIDAHSDFAHADNLEPQPSTTRSEAALLTGRGDAGAIFLDEDTALIGFRRDDPAFLELKKTSILLWPMFWLYEHSRQELDKSLLRRFDRPEIDGIWVHLDADALDPALISAVPHPLADGLTGPELVAILRVLLGTGKVAGMSIANLLTEQGSDGRQVAVIADVLAEALAT
jgi:arginase